MLSRTQIVAEALVDTTVVTFGDLERDSTKTSQITPLMGPAKSVCTRFHVFFVSGHCSGYSRGGPYVANWHFKHSLTNTSMFFPCPN